MMVTCYPVSLLVRTDASKYLWIVRGRFDSGKGYVTFSPSLLLCCCAFLLPRGAFRGNVGWQALSHARPLNTVAFEPFLLFCVFWVEIAGKGAGKSDANCNHLFDCFSVFDFDADVRGTL